MYTFSVRRRSQLGMIYVTCINRFFFQTYVITKIIYEHSGNLPLDVESVMQKMVLLLVIIIKLF